MRQPGFIAAALLCLAAGCGTTTNFPKLSDQQYRARVPAIPAGAAPVFAWRGSRQNLQTYWGLQSVSVEVSAHFPPTWQNPGDGFWSVAGKTGENRPLPFLGVVKRHQNENGTELTLLVPPLDLNSVRDGLYLVLVPGVARDPQHGSIAAITPELHLCEIRRHAFKPFRVRIPLEPLQASPLTPTPEVLPPLAIGTPIPLN